MKRGRRRRKPGICQPPWKIVQPHLRLPHPHYHKWPLHSGDINPALISHPRIHIHNRMHTPLSEFGF
ncbi:hypothetical protein AAMO2058_000692600 [Amorphochlora amoebiformis]